MNMIVCVIAALIGLLMLVFYPTNDMTKLAIVCASFVVSIVYLFKAKENRISTVNQDIALDDILSNRPDGAIFPEKVNTNILANR